MCRYEETRQLLYTIAFTYCIILHPDRLHFTPETGSRLDSTLRLRKRTAAQAATLIRFQKLHCSIDAGLIHHID